MFHFVSICCCLGDAEEELGDCVSETEEEEVVVIASHHVAMATGFGEWEEHTKVSYHLPSRDLAVVKTCTQCLPLTPCV